MREKQRNVLLHRRKSEITKLVRFPRFVQNLLLSCQLIRTEFPSFESLIDEIASTSSPETPAVETFCLCLVLSGHFEAFSKIFDIIVDSPRIRLISMNHLARSLDPLQLVSVDPSPARVAKLCLRRFAREDKHEMDRKKKEKLKQCEELFKLELKLDSILMYFQIYEILSPEQIQAIKGDITSRKCSFFLQHLMESPDSAFERFCHALVLSQQWTLFMMLYGYNLLDLKL